jgi:DNA polymerase-3 subunit alpha
VSEFELDYSFKYPQIYDDPNGEFKQRVIKSFNEKIKNGILDKNLKGEYIDRIKEEFDAYRILNASAYMLFVADIYKWCDKNDIGVGTRGSVTGSFLAFLVGITEIDSVKFGTVFSRFVNSSRISLPDVDMDVPPKDRERIYNYIREQMGADNTSKIIAFGTTKDKGTIDEIVRALGLSLNLGKEIKEAFEIDEDTTREKYPDVMYYFNGIKDVIVSKSEHPAGIVASPITLSDNLGVMRTTNNEIVSSCDMQDIDALNYVKIDVLGLKNMAILNDTYKLANIDPLMSYDMDFDDINVWDDIKKSSIAIFQMESSYAHESLKRIDAKSLDDMTVVNAAIRPSGASYRDRLFAGEINKNPSPEIDEILKESYNFLVVVRAIQFVGLYRRKKIKNSTKLFHL